MPRLLETVCTALMAVAALTACAGPGALHPEADSVLAPAPPELRADLASDVVLRALNFIGAPYRRGGSGAHGFDCSGFTRHIYDQSLALTLPRTADEQAGAAALVQVPRDALRPGDLVFFNTLRRTFSHVGIYVGDGRFVHAPRPGAEVRTEDMTVSYWARRYTGARRAVLAVSH